MKTDKSRNPQLHPAAIARAPTTALIAAPVFESVRARRAMKLAKIARMAPATARVRTSLSCDDLVIPE
jgi:hypothetical protein